MQVDVGTANSADVTLAEGEILHFAPAFLRGRSFGARGFPICPFGSPLTRLWHGRYWLYSYRSGSDGETIALAGHSVTGRFQSVDIAPGERWFVHGAYLAGFLLRPGGAVRTDVMGLLSPTLWILGHPLPMMVHGPATVLLYGQCLTRKTRMPGNSSDSDASEQHFEFLPSQVAACSGRNRFRAQPLNPDHHLLGHVINAVQAQVRWEFLGNADVVVEPLNVVSRSRLWLFVHVIIHLGIWIVAAMVLTR